MALTVILSKQMERNSYCKTSFSFLELKPDFSFLFLSARRVPCGAKDLFNFCWTLFVYTKGRLAGFSCVVCICSELRTSFVLLDMLCCLLKVISV